MDQTAVVHPPTVSGRAARLVVLAGIFGVLIIWPAIVPAYQADRFTQALIFAVIGLSVNILMGYAGQISLGHQAFVGIGAFSAAYFATEQGLPFFLAVPFAGAIGGVTAAILGLVALRIRGLYLALITLAYGAVAERSIFRIPAFTGGDAGMPAQRPSLFAGDASYAYLCLAVLAFFLYVDWRLMRTTFGRALVALRNDETVASSFGINPVFYKVGAFVLSGAIAGIGGGLWAFKNEHVVAQEFTFALALTFVLMVVVGGLGNRLGVVIGSGFVSYLPFLLDWIAERTGFGDLVVLKIAVAAILLILTITRFPGGIAQQIHPLTEWLGGRPSSMHGHHDPEGADVVAAEEEA